MRPLTVPLLVWIMAAGTMALAVLAITASALTEDLGIGATELGLVLLTYSAAAAVLSPIAGPITDRIGGDRAGRLALATAAVGYGSMALAPSVWLLGVTVLPVAFSQAIINPSTNAIIASHVAPGRRGVVTGVKQSGVYVGFVVVGLAAPPLTAQWGWQAAFLLASGLCAVGLLLSIWGLPRTPGSHSRMDGGVPEAARRPLGRLTAYAGLMGFAGSMATFHPLYMETELGFSNAAAGVLTSLTGIVAVVSRILSAGWAERTGRPGILLRGMAMAGVGTNVLFWLAAGAPWLVWVAAGSYSLGLAPWNAVAMLAIIMIVGTRAAGTATGWVVGTFVAGLAIGPVVYGRLIDAVGFEPVWVVSGIAAGLATLTVLGLRVRPVG